VLGHTGMLWRCRSTTAILSTDNRTYLRRLPERMYDPPCRGGVKVPCPGLPRGWP
jgi:hypothetical protein